LNHKDKKTTWEDPRPLPKGWERVVDENGHSMFVEKEQNLVTGTDPRPPIPDSHVKSGKRSAKSSPKMPKKNIKS